MTLELTKSEYSELLVAAMSRIDLLTRALNDKDFSGEMQDKHQKDLSDITRALSKLNTAFLASLEVA